LSDNAAEIAPTDPPHAKPYWLLSLFTPGPADAVEWARGDYTILDRGGRVDGTGELKKQLPMVSEGSVLYAAELRGAAPDVAPDGHPHPVFRVGFALSIPLPEAS
jgi:CRISPR/Cas system CSM-associated protein Csm4 (group 5 of RAMP superfamily)